MKRRRQKLIYLLGFMGSGKSSVGVVLAEELGWPFVDLDATIEAGQGTSICQIFEEAGEPFFRQIEQAALVEVSKQEPAVIALGGGTYAQKANFKFIQENGGVTIWLDSPLEELWDRCATMNNRPLFRDRESFAQLYAQRLTYYRQAQYHISTAGRRPQEIVQEILGLKLF